MTRLDDILLSVAALLTLGAPLVLLRDPGLHAPRTTRVLMARLDADGDGQVSRAEHDRVSMGEPPFETLDLDGSGALELWEVDALLVLVNPNFSRKNLVDREPK